MTKLKGMKKLLLFSTAVLALSSCAEEVEGIKEDISNLPRFGKPKARVSEAKLKQIEHGNSIRKYIYANGYYKFIPIGKDRTVIVARDLDSGDDANWNYIPLLYKFCKAHGGELASGEGFTKVYYKNVGGSDRAGHFGIGNTFYCEGGSYPFKVDHILGRSGTSDTEALIYIKHKPEPFIETKFGFNPEDMKKFSGENLAAFLSSESNLGILATRISHLRSIGAEKWEAEFNVHCPSSFIPMFMDRSLGFIWDAVEYCKVHGGELQRNGKPFPVWFDELITRDKMVGYPYNDKKGNPVHPLNGLYACVGGDKPFEMKVYPEGYWKYLYYYGFILHAGNGFYRKLYPTTVTEKTEKTSEKTEAKPQVQAQTVKPQPSQPQDQVVNPVLSGGLLTRLFAAKAVAMKSDFEKQQGAVLYKAYYDGVDDSNCDLASVLVNNAGAITVYNYRVCNGAISNPSESDLKESIPKEVKKAELKVARLAKDYGAYSMEINGYRLYGKALRDKNYCQVEVRVLHGINLVKIERVNGCQ